MGISDVTTVTLFTLDNTTVEGTANGTAQPPLKPSRSPVAGEHLAVPLVFSGGTLGEDFAHSRPTDRGPTSTTTTLIPSTAKEDDAADETVAVAIPSSFSGDGVILAPIGFRTAPPATARATVRSASRTTTQQRSH